MTEDLPHGMGSRTLFGMTLPKLESPPNRPYHTYNQIIESVSCFTLKKYVQGLNKYVCIRTLFTNSTLAFITTAFYINSHSAASKYISLAEHLSILYKGAMGKQTACLKSLSISFSIIFLFVVFSHLRVRQSFIIKLDVHYLEEFD